MHIRHLQTKLINSMRLYFFLLLTVTMFFSCFSEQGNSPQNSNSQTSQQTISLPVKSVLLYDTILRWPIDTIQAALADINQVIANIESRKAGYSIWKVQSDTIPDYRYLIEGHWPDQASYDSIHINADFRKALDKNVHIFTETRKWDLYRRYEMLDND